MPRLVYSLHFVTEQPPDGGMPVEFIVPLDREGNGAGNIRPIGKPRVVDISRLEAFMASDDETHVDILGLGERLRCSVSRLTS